MSRTYNRPAVVLHWLLALMIFSALPLGFYMHDLPLSPGKLQLYSYHKWLGITVLWLAGVRVVWRLLKEVPPPLPVPRWQQIAAAATHGLLYLLLFAVPLSGWMMSSAKGFTTVYFGVLPLPDLLGKDKALGDVLMELHESLNFVLIALLGLHVAAALKHHFIDRDETLVRMTFKELP